MKQGQFYDRRTICKEEILLPTTTFELLQATVLKVHVHVGYCGV